MAKKKTTTKKKTKTAKKKICKMSSQDMLQPGARGIITSNTGVPGYRK
jgi:hypothetical protein